MPTQGVTQTFLDLRATEQQDNSIQHFELWVHSFNPNLSIRRDYLSQVSHHPVDFSRSLTRVMALFLWTLSQTSIPLHN